MRRIKETDPARYQGLLKRQVGANLRWRRSNRDKVNQSKRRQYAKNPRANCEAQKRWLARNPGANIPNVLRWRAKHPERYRTIQRISRTKYRAEKKTNGPYDRIDPMKVLERDGGRCGICGGIVDPSRFDLDHIIPLSRGGTHQLSNVQVAHPACNKKKRDKMPPESRAPLPLPSP
jgi:5-methylcytosine-specific restriction endonuclease McrA